MSPLSPFLSNLEYLQRLLKQKKKNFNKKPETTAQNYIHSNHWKLKDSCAEVCLFEPFLLTSNGMDLFTLLITHQELSVCK